MIQQKELIRQIEAEDGQAWLLFLDAGRADYFEEFYEDYVDPDEVTYKRVNNGENNMTPYWFKDMFPSTYDGHLFHGGQPIRRIWGDEDMAYDGNLHFEECPSPGLYDGVEMDRPWETTPPDAVNEVVRLHRNEVKVEERLESLGYSLTETPDFNMNVVRYLQPHIPFRMDDQFESQWTEMREAVRDGEITTEYVRECYRDNYEWAMEHAVELAEELADDPRVTRVVITSDHGEMLGEDDQWWHGPQQSGNQELYEVPWLVYE